ncbi:MAG: F0F1 ATP synthase subunit A [Deltaproteobacteria bacterium]|nr:F0F1 ATP synthase subunit A [Deltaproteobacteria bacterium]
MGEHSTWFHLLPGYTNFEQWASHYFKRTWRWEMFQDTHFTMVHVVISGLVVVLLVLGAIAYRRKVAASNASRLVPEATLGTRNVFELVLEATLGIAEGVMGRHKAEKFLPLIGTLVFFILFNNLIGLVPGFIPATDTLKTNIALSGLVFLLTHAYGVREHGLAYFKHFLGPVWWLAPLMLPIELVSHVARPASLALRLMGNMFADHKVLGTFFVLVPILVPLPFYLLGIMVCIVQTLVFTLLTMVYIDMAVAHEEH